MDFEAKARELAAGMMGSPNSLYGKGSRRLLAAARSTMRGTPYDSELSNIETDDARNGRGLSVIPEVARDQFAEQMAGEGMAMAAPIKTTPAPRLAVVSEGPYSRSALPTSTYKNVQHAVMDLMDDRSHGDDILAAAASEVAKEKFPSSGGGFGGKYPVTKDALREYLDAVIRRANELSEDN